VELDDGLAQPDEVRVRRGEGGIWEFELTLREGRHHEVRRLCQVLGLHVERLIRTAYGPVSLGTLRSGEWRELRPAEVLRLTTG
jgi:23S rRNA pseudouridine2605 synthase